jgi:hypothetical protein
MAIRAETCMTREERLKFIIITGPSRAQIPRSSVLSGANFRNFYYISLYIMKNNNREGLLEVELVKADLLYRG